MLLTPATVLALASACAPQVSADTLEALVRVESGLDPLAIGVNGRRPLHLSPQTPQDAIRIATARLAQGQNIDLGLGQINARNLGPLGLTLADAFNPCRNLAAAAQVLRSDWRRAKPAAATPLAALERTLSLYNTGSTWRGLRNGYAAKILASARSAVRAPPQAQALAPPPPRPEWLVFGPDRGSAFVITLPEGVRP